LTSLANALNEEVYFFGFVSFRKFNGRDFDILQTIGLATLGTLKMNMIMMMVLILAMFIAKSILESATVVQDFVDDPSVKKCFQRAVNSDPVERGRNFLLNVRVRKRMRPFDK
jgi:hypothetical protein